ncbi:hypothetical protein vseg_014679 [Gypsophila vaccaria]
MMKIMSKEFTNFLLFLTFMICFSNSSAEITQNEMQSKHDNDGDLVQSSSSTKSTRIDPSRVVQLSWQPRVFVYKGFASDEECDHLISLASGKTNSVVSDTQGLNARSLASLDVKDEVLASLEEKMSVWTLLPPGNSKPLQVIHYANEEANQKYDFYGTNSSLQVNEYLMATVILYLSDSSRGGEISFPDTQIKTSRLKSKMWSYGANHNNLLKPVKGNAILFFNVHPSASPDKNSRHERNPVTKGKMWSAIKLFHLKSVDEMKAQSEPENSDCTDEDDSCPNWAALGECQRNPVFMVGSPDYYGTCRKSCNAC